jgi:hypothetical protein
LGTAADNFLNFEGDGLELDLDGPANLFEGPLLLCLEPLQPVAGLEAVDLSPGVKR